MDGIKDGDGTIKAAGAPGTDLRGKVEAFSSSMYNKGLRLAQQGAISDAALALEKSLEFSKKNVQARNLLGLCYYALGRLGDALEHWIISKEYQPENNLAEKYLIDIRENQRQVDRVNHSIALYNSALDFCRGGSGDMAIIRLKKCVELNPVFVDALNLLALCYISSNKANTAELYVKRALQIDPFNAKALSYYAEITGVAQGVPRKRGSGKPQLMDVNGYSNSANKRNIVSDFHISEIVAFILGCAILAAVYSFLVLPDREASLNEQVVRLNDTIAMTRAAGELALEQKDLEYKDFDDTLRESQLSVSELTYEKGLLERQIKIYKAEEYYDEGKYLNAYSEAVETMTDGFTMEFIQRHSQILHDSASSIENMYYTEGKKYYDAGNYPEAKFSLGVAERYTQSDSKTADLMYYYLGRIAEREENFTEAARYYEIVVTGYPDSSQYKDANTRLGKINDR